MKHILAVFVFLLLNLACSALCGISQLAFSLHVQTIRVIEEQSSLPRALSPAFFLNLRLLFLAVLESGAPLSSPLEEALYKCSV